MLRGWRWPLILLCLGIIGYMAASRLTFAAPTTMAESNECGFNPADFTPAGQLRFSTGQAWWASFMRQQEYFSAFSLGLVVAFIGFAVGKGRQKAELATRLGILLALLLLPTVVRAENWETILTPARPGIPLANPITTEELPPPPFSLLKDRPVNPIYVPGLPGLPQGKLMTDDYGNKKPKYDGIIIRQSRVENGQVIIPPGGLVYLEDTWRGEVALVGEQLAYLGKEPIYIDYDMSIVVKKDVTIPSGESVVIGGQVYHYYATVGHGRTANHTLHVRTIGGTDWEWAFGHPVLSTTQTNWWEGKRFAQLYNQGQAREVTPKQLVFDWISGVRTDRLLMANKKVFAGLATPGQEWRVGEHTVRLARLDEQAGTATIQVLEGSRVVLDKTLGPVQTDLLIEDSGARKAVLFEYKDIAGFLVPWPKALQDGKAQLKIYGDVFSIRYGADYPDDPRFATYPIGCPTGHNFGIMWTNKAALSIPPGGNITGPERYFKIIVEHLQGNEVAAWHVEDQQGNRSINLGGAGVTNIDLVLGQGRITGQAILKDVGKAALERLYTAIKQQ
jgi:hypothetical protein